MAAETQVREYLRVSQDTSGRERSPQEQHADNERAAAELGFQILNPPYRDIGSASRYARKARTGFDQLVADLTNGAFNADVLMLWESSRGSRKVGEWVELVELCERRGVKIHVTTHSRTYDPANHRDRRTLLEDAVDSEYESAKKSDRLKRSAAAGAAEGRAVSRVPYGYRSEYDPRTGRPKGRVPEPDEAKVVAELFRKVAEGKSLRSIAAELAERGIEKRSGGPFSAPHLRSMLNYRGYIGERAYIPGRKERWQRRAEATVTKAQWEPIVDRTIWFAVHAILADQSRVKNRPGGARHLLSMIARCDPCGGVLNAIVEKQRYDVYRCRDRGCVRVDKSELDQLAIDRALSYLTSPAVYAGLKRVDDESSEALADIERKLGDVRLELTDLEQRVSAGRLTLEFAERVEPGIRARLKALQEQRDTLATPTALRGLFTPGEDARARWDAMDITQRRRLLTVVLVPRLAGELRVLRSPIPRQRVPAGDRVVFARRG